MQARRPHQHARRVRSPELRRLAALIWMLLCFFISTFSAQADPKTPPPWAVPDAPYRVGIRLRTPPSKPEAGIKIYIADYGLARQDLSDLLLIGPDGQPQPIAKIGHRPGGYILLLAQNLEAQSQYFLYFGGDKARVSPTWTPKISLLMETKPAPANLKFDSIEDLKLAWNQSSEPAGADFVNQIFQGGNPFGPNVQFLTHFSGYLQLPEAKAITFYTLSSDCSFVLINDQYQFGWPGQHSPRAFPDSVPKKEVHCPVGLVKVDYYAAKGEVAPGERLEAGMVLGWMNEQGNYETVPPAAWLHAGTSSPTSIQENANQGLPIPKITVESFVGYNNLWLYQVAFSIYSRKPLEQTTSISWEFEDGAILSGSAGERILTGRESQLVKCILTRNGTPLTELYRLDIPDKIQRASVNDPETVRHLLDSITSEANLKLNEESIHARLAFIREFGTDQDLAKFASKLDAHPRNGSLWLSAQLALIRMRAQTEPQQARNDFSTLLSSLPADLRQGSSIELANTEMDLLVFCLRDSSSFGRLGQIGFLNATNNLSKVAKIRVGDLYRLLGNFKEAVAQYKGIGITGNQKTMPLKDTAESIAIRDLLEKGYPLNAKTRLEDWELRHPMAKFDSDFLLLRARTLILLGRWAEARAELESYQKVQADSPFQIDAQFYLARILFEQGQKDEARKLWTSISTDYPKHPLAEQAKEWASKP